MTGALVVYAATFMRYSLAVRPANYLLFACHLTNFGAQSTQGVRYLNHNYFGGKDAVAQATDNAKDVAEKATDKVKDVAEKAKEVVKSS